jgi:hypothetical protein
LGPNGLMHATEDIDGSVNIFWGGQLYYSFNRNNLFEKNLGIALLDSIGVVQKTIREFFKVSRNTITNVSKIYTERGIDGLQSYAHGAPQVEGELKAFIIHSYINIEGTRGYQKKILESIEEKVEAGEFKKGISRSTLHNIIRDYKNEKEEQKRKNKEKKSVEERKEERPLKSDGNDKGDGQLELVVDPAEGEEVCVEHGGAIAAVAFFDEYGMAEAVPKNNTNGHYYSNQELAITFALLNAGEIVTVEQDFELLLRHEMGGIIGKSKLPSLSLYRNRIPGIVEQMDMREVILETSKRMHQVLEFSRVVYIDGHFMPYHGAGETLYGYNSQKRLAMHGREYFFVHDTHGVPVYATISDGYRRMKHYIVDVDEKLREIYGVREKELLEIFDRGGYSKEFCVNIAERIRFICWRSDARTVPKVEEWTEVIGEHRANEYGQLKEIIFHAWEREAVLGTEGNAVRMREIWIRKGNKISPALTNDFQLPLEEVVKALTGRWGCQENMFKELKDHGIDRIHSYGKQEYTKEFLYKQGLEDAEQGTNHEIDNPEIRVINKTLSSLRVKLRKLAERIITLEASGEEKRLVRSRNEYTSIEARIAEQLEMRSLLPVKVNQFDRIKENQIIRLCDEKKLFFDWLKMNAIWAKREIIEIVKPCYQNLRDVNKFVKTILSSRTYMRRKEDTLFVDFPFQSSKKKHAALLELCRYLNEHGKIDLGLNYQRLVFGVQEKH